GIRAGGKVLTFRSALAPAVQRKTTHIHARLRQDSSPSEAQYSSNHKEAQIRAELDVSQDPGPHSPGSWGQPIINGRQ
ncbi:hypothetical protein D4764_13G0010220, partial [Takifugu flavidus]